MHTHLSGTATRRPAASRHRWLSPGVLMGLLTASILIIIAAARQTPPTPQAAAPAQQERAQMRTLRFIDQPDGAVAAIDASGKLVQRFEGEQGFLRGTLRAMARERRMRRIGADQPFELILHRDGRLTLYDPSAGTRIALESFGPDNTRVFARLLD